MKLRYFILLFCILSNTLVRSQSIERVVIGSSAINNSANGIEFNSTFGEAVVSTIKEETPAVPAGAQGMM